MWWDLMPLRLACLAVSYEARQDHADVVASLVLFAPGDDSCRDRDAPAPLLSSLWVGVAGVGLEGTT
jgi:hypothetical protein